MNTSYKWVNAENNSKYTWDYTIGGKYGTFIYKNSNNEIIKEEITVIGEIKECSKSLEYSHINDCIGISEISSILNDYPMVKKIGWDSNIYCWVFFNNNSTKPAYYAKKL
jgi:hypothetical protein